MNYEKTIDLVMHPARWLADNEPRPVNPTNLRKLGLMRGDGPAAEQSLMLAAVAIQSEFLTHIPRVLQILNSLELYTEHYSSDRAPAGLKPRLALEVREDGDGTLSVHWLPHDDDFIGMAPMIRDDDSEVNCIIVLTPEEHLGFPPNLPASAEAGYRQELYCAILEGLRSLVLACITFAEVDLEAWLEFDPQSGSFSISTPDMRAELLAFMGHELCTEELAKQQGALNTMLLAAGFADMDAYRAVQRAAGPGKSVSKYLLATEGVTLPEEQLAQIDEQVQDVLRLERELANFTRTLVEAEAASDA